MHKGDQSDSLYLIEVGQVKVYVTDDSGKQTTLRFLGPGEMFGELGFLLDKRRTASVDTTEDSRLIIVTSQEFNKVLAEDEELRTKLIRFLACRVEQLTEELAGCRMKKNLPAVSSQTA